MKSTAIVCAIAALSLGFGSLAQARDRDHDGRDDRQGWEQRHEQRDGQRGEQRGDRRDHQREQQRNVQRGTNFSAQTMAPNTQYSQYTHRDTRRVDGWRGQQQYGSYNTPRFYQGGYVPTEYRHHRYYVNDWRARRLSAPPYGYQWMQVDNGDYILMAIATGLIANLLMNQY